VPAWTAVDRAPGRRRHVLDHRSGFNHQHLRLEKARGHRVPAPRENPRVGLARDTHAPGRRILVKAFEVGEPDGFEFVEADPHRVRLGRRLADRAEPAALQVATDVTGDRRA
jgi:hypothetical protein